MFSNATFYVLAIDGNQESLAYISTSIAFLGFVCILVYHTYEFVLPSKLKNKVQFNFIPLQERPKPDNVIPAGGDDFLDSLDQRQAQCTYTEVEGKPDKQILTQGDVVVSKDQLNTTTYTSSPCADVGLKLLTSKTVSESSEHAASNATAIHQNHPC